MSQYMDIYIYIYIYIYITIISISFSIYLFFFVELCDICSEPISLSNGSLAVSNDDEWQSLDMSPHVIQKIHKVLIQNLFTGISIHYNHIKVELLERIDIKGKLSRYLRTRTFRRHCNLFISSWQVSPLCFWWTYTNNARNVNTF